MKIGLLMYANDYPNRGGVWRYNYNLAKNLLELDTEDEYVFIHGKSTPDNFKGLEANEALRPMGVLGKLLKLPGELAGEGFDVVHETANTIPRFSWQPYRKVATVHDLAGLRYPETTNAKGRALFRWYLPYVLKHVDVVVVPSENTKREIIEYYGIPGEKLRVIKYGVEERFFEKKTPVQIRATKEKLGIHWPFLLWVGAVNRHKNIKTVLEAFLRLPKEFHSSLKLVLAGYMGDMAQDTFSQIREYGLSDAVVSVGAVSDEELSTLYQAAEMFVFPSFYEGFGFPALEAMASGCPVLASNAASLPEVVGKEGLLLSPDAPDAWAEAIEKVMRSAGLREELSAQGIRRAKEFTWGKTAERHLSVYRGEATG